MSIMFEQPTICESFIKFVTRVADGKATSEELAFMTEMARKVNDQVAFVDKSKLVEEVGKGLGKRLGEMEGKF